MISLDADAKTSAAHGCKPHDRTIEQLLAAGMIVIDKPSGPNSHQVSAWARDILGVEKLGHGGTLDPFATGVLVLLAGRSMRLTKKKRGGGLGLPGSRETHSRSAVLRLSQSPRDPESDSGDQ